MYLSQVAVVTTGNLKTVNDVTPGSTVSGSVGYPGQMGQKMRLGPTEAVRMGLKPGVYQYVTFRAADTAAPAAGLACFWSNMDSYVVTCDAAATNVRMFAGIVLGAVTKGNSGWIQITGQATVKFKATLTKVAVIGDLVVVDQTPGNTGDVLADATSLTSPLAGSLIGTAVAAPTNGSSTLVLLWGKNVVD
jgi:hypothetical protein